MQRSSAHRALRRLLGVSRPALGLSGRQPLAASCVEPLSLQCNRLTGGLQWRGFAEQTQQQRHEDQEASSTSKASSDEASSKAEKPDADEKKAEGGADGKEEGAKDGDKAADAEAEANAEEEKELTPVEKLQRDLEDFQEKSRGKKKELLLALANFENEKKKLTKERQRRASAAHANFGIKMVEVYREFEELPALKAEASSEACKALQEGVIMTRDIFGSAMDKSNIERLPVELGTPLVNARHEVVGSAPGDGSMPDGSIAEVTEAGWIMDMRSSSPHVLAKAKVKTVGAA